MNNSTGRGPRLGGLALKFNLLITSLIAVTVLTLVATSAFYYRSKTSDELIYHGQSILNVLAELSERQMLNLDYDGLEHAVEALAYDSKITHAAFYDIDGNLLVHNDKESRLSGEDESHGSYTRGGRKRWGRKRQASSHYFSDR